MGQNRNTGIIKRALQMVTVNVLLHKSIRHTHANAPGTIKKCPSVCLSES